MAQGWTIGILGGSGLYAIDALEDAQWIAIESPWGTPSDEVLKGRIGAVISCSCRAMVAVTKSHQPM